MFKPSVISIAVTAVLAGHAVAYAQEAAQAKPDAAKLERVQITGSRIRTVQDETAQPVITLSSESIQKSGLTTLGDVLNTMTVAGAPDFSKGGALTSNREMGGQYLNMRNLGSNRLLVLVNGRRWTQSVAGYTDMSTIPTSVIDRIEILKDGASSIYGSDAIAGVVNIILKKSMDGGEVSVQYGQNQLGDGKAYDANLTYGTRGEKGSLMMGLTYSKQAAVWARSREITGSTYGFDKLAFSLGSSPWGRMRNINPANGQAMGMNMMLNHTGTYDGVGVGADSRNVANYHTYTGSQADTYNSSQDMMFTIPTELKTAFVKGGYDIRPDVRLSSTLMYAQRDSSTQVAGYPLNSMTQFSYPVYLDKDSYYNPYNGSATPQDLFFYRRTIERPRITSQAMRSLHFDVGLDGDFSVGNNAWNWNVYYNHNQADATIAGSGNINLLNLKRALGPSFMNSAGVVQCGTAAAPIALSNCVPFNILGGPTGSTPAALDYVMARTQGTNNSMVRSLGADISGELFKLPAGKVGVAFGLEARGVGGKDTPDQMSSNGYTTDLAAKPTNSTYSVKEAYGEINIPLLKRVPGAYELSTNISSRYSQYSNFGNTTNSKISFIWRPVADLLARGTWSQGFRAPTIADISGGGSQTFDTYLDPCDSLYGAAKSTPSVAARCAAAGVPATFRQVNQAGNAVGGGGAQSTTAFNSGVGNSTLTPETAVTKTLGLAFSPSFVPGLNASIDWYRINVDNQITAISANYVLNQCYVQGVQTFCNQVGRDPSSGAVTSLSRGNLNLGFIETEGVDMILGYRLPAFSFGQVNLRSETTYLTSYKTRSTQAANWVNYAGEAFYPRIKSNFIVDWRKGDWTARVNNRYVSSYKGSCWDTSDTTTCSNPNDSWSGGTGYNVMGARVFTDLAVTYQAPWKGRFLVGVNNILGVKPRRDYDVTASASAVDPNSPIDRFFYVRYTQAF